MTIAQTIEAAMEEMRRKKVDMSWLINPVLQEYIEAKDELRRSVSSLMASWDDQTFREDVERALDRIKAAEKAWVGVEGEEAKKVPEQGQLL